MRICVERAILGHGWDFEPWWSEFIKDLYWPDQFNEKLEPWGARYEEDPYTKEGWLVVTDEKRFALFLLTWR